jgi:hypothetical protein
MAPESAATAEGPLKTATADGRDYDGPPTERALSGSSGAPVHSEGRTQLVLGPRKKVFIGVSRMVHERNPTGHWNHHGPNGAAAPGVRMRARHTVVVVGIALTLVACAGAPPGGDGKPVDRPSEQATAVRYALGVGGGDCPPDVAFYHSRGSTNTIELGIIASAGQIVSYSVESNDPAYAGRRDHAVVAAGDNGHTFAIDVPISAVVSVSVSASGSADERGGTCRAAAL